MGYDFHAVNPELDHFHMGGFLWPHFLEQCGYYFICIQQSGGGGKWHFISGIDERMPEDDKYPRLVSNDGFPVTDEESKVLARIARNYVTTQRYLEDQSKEKDDFLEPAYRQTWPRKVREDWVDHLAKFADWMEQSQGFEIW